MTTETARQQWDRKVRAIMDRQGLTRAKASSQLQRRDPYLHTLMLNEANQGKPNVQRQIFEAYKEKAR